MKADLAWNQFYLTETFLSLGKWALMNWWRGGSKIGDSEPYGWSLGIVDEWDVLFDNEQGRIWASISLVIPLKRLYTLKNPLIFLNIYNNKYRAPFWWRWLFFITQTPVRHCDLSTINEVLVSKNEWERGGCAWVGLEKDRWEAKYSLIFKLLRIVVPRPLTPFSSFQW